MGNRYWRPVRRVLVIFALLALVLPAAATAAGVRASDDDGTLTIKDGNGYVQIVAKGGVIGRFTSGVLLVRDPNPDDTYEEVVTGTAVRSHDIDDHLTRYTGKNLRFRYIGGRFKVTIQKGLDIDLSAVGQGKVTIKGAGTTDDGTYTLNDQAPEPILPFLTPLDLLAPAVP
jgi:hypothetical protein